MSNNYHITPHLFEILLTEINDSGWLVSWVFQYSPGEWRASIIKSVEDGHLVKSCISAPTLYDAILSAWESDHEMFQDESTGAWSVVKADPNAGKPLLSMLGLIPKVVRRL